MPLNSSGFQAWSLMRTTAPPESTAIRSLFCPPGTMASPCACPFSTAAGGTPGAPKPPPSSARSADAPTTSTSRVNSTSPRVPIVDGGRRDARRAETASQFRQERVHTNDLHEQMERDIRSALDSLHSAEEQFKVAEEGLTLSDSELTQARRRYEAGFASNLEVTDAQTRLDRARDNRLAALFGYNVARIDLGRAMGNVRRMIQ